VIIVEVPVPTTPTAGGESGAGASGLVGGGSGFVCTGTGFVDGGTGAVITLGVVPVEPVEPGVAGVGVVTGGVIGVVGVGVGTGVGVVTGGVIGVAGVGVGTGVGVTAGLGGTKVSLDTITCAVGAVGLEPSHAQTKSASRTNALIRVMPQAGATAIPRRVVTAEPSGLPRQ